jgi:hypothetical protein
MVCLTVAIAWSDFVILVYAADGVEEKMLVMDVLGKKQGEIKESPGNICHVYFKDRKIVRWIYRSGGCPCLGLQMLSHSESVLGCCLDGHPPPAKHKEFPLYAGTYFMGGIRWSMTPQFR